jgi:hypothetical protein
MISDLFDCKMCGNSAGFERLDALDTLSRSFGTDFLCLCKACDNLFITVFKR